MPELQSILSRDEIVGAALKIIECIHEYPDLNAARWFIEAQAFVISRSIS